MHQNGAGYLGQRRILRRVDHFRAVDHFCAARAACEKAKRTYAVRMSLDTKCQHDTNRHAAHDNQNNRQRPIFPARGFIRLRVPCALGTAREFEVGYVFGLFHFTNVSN